jgi:hypothetical protein
MGQVKPITANRWMKPNFPATGIDSYVRERFRIVLFAGDGSMVRTTAAERTATLAMCRHDRR